MQYIANQVNEADINTNFVQKNFGAPNDELLTDATISYINIASGFKGLLAPASYDDAAAITLLPVEISKVNGNGN